MKPEALDIEALNFDFFYLKSAIDASHNGIVVVDAEGLIVVFNKAAERILNREEQDIVGTPFKEFDPRVWPDYETILKTGIPQIGEKNKVRDVTTVANRAPILVKGNVEGVISVFQDISEFEEISKELSSFKHLAKELDTIIESSYDGISMTDGEGVLLRVNSSWEKITGLKAKEVTGRSMEELESEGYISEAIPLLALKHRSHITKPSRVLKSGRDVLVTSTPIFDENENITMVVTNVRDMTDLNNLNKQLERSKKLAKKYYSKLIKMEMDQHRPDEIVAVSKEMSDVVELALRIADTDAPVLVQGETGVGKEVVAKLIHKNSNRSKKGHFVKINCGAIPENLLESELFGYEKGAFTGARESGKKGRFEQAEGGTIFLDEIEALSLNLQVKLLGAVQDLEIMSIGGSKPKKVNARIIAASNRDLYRMVQKNTFREDLFFRLNVVPVYIPPLRERKEDVMPLVNFFLQLHNHKYKKNKKLSRSVMDYLIEYRWDGNVRELRNLIEQLVVVTHENEIVPEDLPGYIRTSQITNLANYPFANISSLKQAVMEFESHLILEAINKYGNARRAANFLKVDPSTITRKMKKIH